MTALAQDRNTPRAERGFIKQLGVAAAMLIYGGALVMRNSAGYAEKGAAGAGSHGVGRANIRVDNTDGSAGDLNITVEEGIFSWANSGSSDEITIADIGKLAYVVDDQTVAKTSDDGARSPAGIVVAVDSLGVQVLMGDDVIAGFLAARKYVVQARVATLVGSNTYQAVAPLAGRVAKVWSITEGVLTSGDATLTPKINGVAMTGGLITITQAGSAAGDIDSAAPSALNAVAAGDALAVTVGGSNATATVANVYFEIERD